MSPSPPLDGGISTKPFPGLTSKFSVSLLTILTILMPLHLTLILPLIKLRLVLIFL